MNLHANGGKIDAFFRNDLTYIDGGFDAGCHGVRQGVIVKYQSKDEVDGFCYDNLNV